MPGDAVIFGLSAAGLVALVVTVDRVHRRSGWSAVPGRRLVRVLAGPCSVVAPLPFTRPEASA